jgi:hypothetical protein
MELTTTIFRAFPMEAKTWRMPDQIRTVEPAAVIFRVTTVVPMEAKSLRRMPDQI